MTVKELIEKLEGMPGDAVVVFRDWGIGYSDLQISFTGGIAVIEGDLDMKVQANSASTEL